MTDSMQCATLAGGCFWCLEAVFLRLRGVASVRSGYCGGMLANPGYEQVCTGLTGHAEAVEIRFDPQEISYGELLEVFFAIHDPTTLNRQGHDVGTQYRSAIFTHSGKQASEAARTIAALDAGHVFAAPIVTEVCPAAPFHPAEEMHARYFDNHPRAPYCQAVIAPKMAKLSGRFGARLKAGQGGFTSVEILAVIAILLLLGIAALLGMDFSETARVKALALDFRNVPMLVEAYRTRFDALPGDDARAATHLEGARAASTPGVVGNHVLDGAWDSVTKTDETFLLWQHLRLAKLLDGPRDIATVVDRATAEAFLPKNAEGGRIGIESAAAHYIRDAAEEGAEEKAATFLVGTYVVCSAGIPGGLALQLDAMLDDGDPQTGALRIVPSGHVRGTPAAKSPRGDDLFIACMGG